MTNQSTLTCPKCQHQQLESIPTDKCLAFYKCQNCDQIISPKDDDCCVFCSYGDEKCPVG